MALKLSHVTLKDPTLTHQVIFSVRKNVLNISCNCRMGPGKNEKAGKLTASPMGSCRSIEESRQLYNDPANHWAPFTDEDKAKW